MKKLIVFAAMLFAITACKTETKIEASTQQKTSQSDSKIEQTKKLQELILEKYKDAFISFPYVRYENGRQITGSIIFANPNNCIVVHKVDNIYEATLCDPNNTCISIEILYDGNNCIFKNKGLVN